MNNPVYNGDSYSKSELARAYKISKETLSNWLYELRVDTGAKKILAPKVIRALIEKKGEPNWENLGIKKAP